MSRVLRTFDYSFDGVTALKANVDDDIDFREMTAGLEAEGYVAAGEPVAAVEPEPVIEPVVEPVVEPVIEPLVDATPEPVVPAPAPTPEPAPQPTKTRKRSKP